MLLAPGSASDTSFVPSEVPSVRQSSRPCCVVYAVK